MPEPGSAPASSGNFWVSGDFQGLDSPKKNFKNEPDEFYSNREKERVRVQCCCERSKRYHQRGHGPTDKWIAHMVSFGILCISMLVGGELSPRSVAPNSDSTLCGVLFLIWSILETSRSSSLLTLLLFVVSIFIIIMIEWVLRSSSGQFFSPSWICPDVTHCCFLPPWLNPLLVGIFR